MQRLTRKFTEDYRLHGLLFLGFLIGGTIIVAITTILVYRYITLSFPLRNFQSGLADHIRYLESFSAAVAMSVYILFGVFMGIRKKTLSIAPWVIASAIESVLLVISMYDRSRPAFSYPLSDAAVGWMQIFVLLPVVVGYLILFWMNRKEKQHTKTYNDATSK